MIHNSSTTGEFISDSNLPPRRLHRHPRPQILPARTNRTCPGSIRKTRKEAKGKNSFKSMEEFAQKLFHRADIVRDFR